MGAVKRAYFYWLTAVISLFSFGAHAQIQIGDGSGNIINSPVEQCGNGAISLSALSATSGATLTWSVLSNPLGNGTLALSSSSGTTITVTPNATAFTVYRVELSESTTNKDTITIAVAPLTVFPTAFPSTLCENNGVETIESNASSNTSYSATGGTIIQSGNNWKYNPQGQSAGNITLTKTVSYSNTQYNVSFSCSDNKTLAITKPNNPSLSLGAPFIIKCQTATSISVSPANGSYVLKQSGQSTYVPFSSSINNSGSFNTSILSAGSGQSLGYFYTDVNGCISDTAFVSFNVVEPIIGVQSYLNGQYSTVSATNSVYSVCGGYDSLSFQLQLPNSSAFPSLDIDWGDGTVQTSVSNPDSISHQFDQQGLYTIDLNLYNSSGCSVSKEVKVFFGTTPPVGLTSLGGLSGCIGLGGYSDTFLFRVEDPLDLPVGLEMTFSSNNGSSSFTVTTPLIDTSVSPPTTVHPRLRLDSTDGELYYYHVFDDGSCGTTSVLGTPQPNSFYVTAVCVSPCGPGADPLGPIYISEAPSAGANVPSTACAGSTINISDNSTSGQAINTSTGTCNSSTKGIWKILGNSSHTIVSGSKGFIPNGSFGNNPANWISGSNSLSVSFSNSGTYTVRRIIAVLQSSNPDCTIDSVDYQICIDTIPLAQLVSNRLDTVCASSTVPLELETDSINCANQTTYSIKLYQGSNLIETLLDSAGNKGVSLITPSSYGEYFLEYTLSNSCGSSSLTDSFYVFEPVEVVPIETSSTYCQDSVVLEIGENLFDVNTDSSDAYLDSIYISPSSGWEILGTGEYRFNSYGTYDVKAFYQGFCNADSAQYQLILNTPPVAAFSLSDSTGCSPFSPGISLLVNNPNYTHSWFVSNINGSVVDSAFTTIPTFTFSNTSNTADSTFTIIHYVFDGISSCLDTAEINIVVYPNPSAGFSLASPICAGSAVTVGDTSQGNGLVYRWQASGGVVISDTTADEPTFTFPDNQAPNTDTTYTITLIVTSEDGCKDTALQNVVIHARPLADFGIDSAQCGSYVGVLHDSSVFNGPGPLIYAWSVVANVSGAGTATLSSATAASPTLSIPAPSIDSVTYRITLTVTDSYGCTDEKLDSIKVYARPTSLFTVSDVDTCGVYDLSGKITDASTNGFSTNATSGLERRWLVERDNVLLHDSVGLELDYALTNSGVDDSVYTITLMVANERGCMDTSSVDVTIYPDARAEVVANASLYNCAPFLVDTSIVSAVDYPNANDTYTWNVYDSLTGTLVYGPVNSINGLSFTLPVADSTVLIVLSTSNANGCGDDSDTIIVGTLPNPDASFTFYQDTVCSGDSIYMSLLSGNGQTTYDWYIDSTGNGMQYITSGTNSFISVLENDGDTALQQMLIKCVATVGSTGCSDSITLPISVRPNPVPSFTQNLVCGLDTVQLMGNTAKNSLIQTWNWVLGTSLLTGQTVNTYYGNAGYYSGILATTTYNGCMRQVADSIVVYDYPTASFGINTLCAPDTTCAGETIVFNDSSQTTNALQGIVNSWGWDIANDGTVESTVQNYTTSLNGYGPVEIELLVSNQYGCADSILKSTFIQVEPQAEINFTLDTTCAPWQTSFVVQDTGYIDSTYYVLRALDGLNSVIIGQGETVDSVIKTLQPNYLTDSIYTIEHTVWNCCGSSTDFDSIYLKTPPVADYVVVPDTGCTPLTVTFMLQNRIRGNATSAALDFGNGRIDTITPQLIVSPSGIVSIWPTLSETYTYGGFVDTTYFTSLTVWNECDDSTFSVAVNVQPNTVNALIDAPSTEGCAPFTVGFENLTSGATNYSWCFDWDGATCNGGGSNSFEPTWTYSTPGTYEVAMFANNGCGYDTAYLEIIVNPSPTSSFTHNAPVCANDSLILTNTSSVNSGFISVNNWTLDSLITSQSQDLSYIITQGGSYGVSLFVESDNGCSDSSYQVITINHNPKVNFSFNNTCWNEQPVQFYDSTAIQGANINYTYWDFGDGNGSIGLNPTHTYAQPGTYQVKLIKGSTQGCLDSMVQSITIFDIPETQFRAVLTSGDSCSVPQTYEFQNQTTGAQAYLWDFDYLNSPGQFTSSQTTPSFTYVNAGVYRVRLISFNAFGCTDTTFKTVVVNDGVVADFDVSPVNGCDPLTLNLLSQPIFNRQLDTIAYVRWELSNGWISTTPDSISFVTIDQPGQYELNYFVYTNQGCSDSIIGQMINVYPTPEPDFSISKVDIRTFDFVNTGVYLDTTLQFLWSFGDGDTSNAFSPRHRYLQTTMMDSLQVCLIVRNSFNCFESICKPIFMWDYNLSVPNSIVPERTQFGEDALFLPKGHDLMTYSLSIFDKWGNLVFETTEINDGAPAEAWNGRLNNQGEILPMGAYVWKIEATFNDGHVWQGNSLTGEKPKRYGTLMLIR